MWLIIFTHMAMGNTEMESLVFYIENEDRNIKIM